MLGFSLQKLLVLALLVGAVWYGFKYVGRLDAARKRVTKAARAAAEKAAEHAAGGAAGGDGGAASEPVAQDMERCETCGDYVAAVGASSCGREACPYPG